MPIKGKAHRQLKMTTKWLLQPRYRVGYHRHTLTRLVFVLMRVFLIRINSLPIILFKADRLWFTLVSLLFYKPTQNHMITHEICVFHLIIYYSCYKSEIACVNSSKHVIIWKINVMNCVGKKTLALHGEIWSEVSKNHVKCDWFKKKKQYAELFL